jgi:hypothetical protein
MRAVLAANDRELKVFQYFAVAAGVVAVVVRVYY